LKPFTNSLLPAYRPSLAAIKKQTPAKSDIEQGISEMAGLHQQHPLLRSCCVDEGQAGRQA